MLNKLEIMKRINEKFLLIEPSEDIQSIISFVDINFSFHHDDVLSGIIYN